MRNMQNQKINQGVYNRLSMGYNVAMDDLDHFLETEQGLTIEPEELGTTIVPPKQMTKKDMNESILRVYTKLGGDAWLLKQAHTFPKEFMNMLKPLIEKNEIGSITGISITVDGNSVSVEGRSYKELGVLNAGRH